MQNSKLIRLLTLFSLEEMERFKVFVQSPFFNTNSNLVTLIEHIASFFPDFDHPDLAWEKTYLMVFEQKATNKSHHEAVIKLASKLTKLAKAFLAHAALAEDEMEGAALRKQWFQRKKAIEWSEAELREMQSILYKYPLIDEYFMWNKYRISSEWARINAISNPQIEQIEIEAVSQNLDAYYLRAKMEHLCHLSNQSLVLGQKKVIEEQESIESLYALNQQNLSEPLAIWFKAWQTLLDPSNETKYDALKKSLLKEFNYLSLAERQTIFVYLHHASRIVFKDTDEYFAEMNALHKLQISLGILLNSEGHIYTIALFNIISVAIRQQEIEWAAQFFEAYKDKLDPASENSESILLLCQSIIQFEQGLFGDSLDTLNAAAFKDIQGKLAERRLRLKIYHELGYFDLFLDQINTFRKFLSVNKDSIPKHHYEGCLNFIQASVHISKLVQNKAKNQSALRNLLETTVIMPEKHWIERHL
jgi:hypothetical protein